jgi:hypothetical protein
MSDSDWKLLVEHGCGMERAGLGTLIWGLRINHSLEPASGALGCNHERRGFVQPSGSSYLASPA